MQPTPDLIRQLHREKIERTRRMTLEQKFMAGAELFDCACEISKAGIRSQNPDFTEQQVMEELRRRVWIGQRRENWG